MTITTTQLYTMLSEKVGKEAAENLTTYIEAKVREEVTFVGKDLATKEFVRAEVSDAKSDTIKWMFIFWIGQMATFIALFLFKK